MDLPTQRALMVLVLWTALVTAACSQGEPMTGAAPPAVAATVDEQEGPAAAGAVPEAQVRRTSNPATSPPPTFEFEHPLGFALSLPQGWSPVDAGGGQYQIVLPDARANEAIGLTAGVMDGAFSATSADAILSTEQEISRQYPQLRRIGPPQSFATQSGDAVRLDWEGPMPDGSLARLAVYLASVDNVAVSILSAGLSDDVMARGNELVPVFASLRKSVTAPTTPALPPSGLPGQLHDGSAVAIDWTQALAGKKLTVLSGYSSSGSSGGMTARYDMVLYHNGSFVYSGSSSVSMSVDGMGGSSVSQESSEGSWRIVSQGAAAFLELTSDQGKQFGELTRRGSETYLSGTRVFVTDP